MEQQNINLQEIQRRLTLIENALKNKGINVEINESSSIDDEGEIIDEFKAKLEKRRKSTNYISHEEVKKRILTRK